jgi:hypothetical protein
MVITAAGVGAGLASRKLVMVPWSRMWKNFARTLTRSARLRNGIYHNGSTNRAIQMPGSLP